MSTAINKENSIAVLVNSVRFGQKMGAYALREAKLLKQAIEQCIRSDGGQDASKLQAGPIRQLLQQRFRLRGFSHLCGKGPLLKQHLVCGVG